MADIVMRLNLVQRFSGPDQVIQNDNLYIYVVIVEVNIFIDIEPYYVNKYTDINP
jgi:hypothetical protein